MTFNKILIKLVIAMLMMVTVNAAPSVGSVAPDFQLLDQHSKLHTLNNYRGQWLILYFYPKDNTPGCTIEAGKFRDNKKQLAARNAIVFGISIDDVESHLDFSETLELNFSLLADDKKTVSKSYDVLTDLAVFAYSQRETFIIDPEGRIAHHFKDVDPKTHADIVLSKLDELIEIYK